MAYFNDQAMTTPNFYGSNAVDPSIFNTGGVGKGFFDSQAGFQPGYEAFSRNFAGSTNSKFYNFLQQRFFQNQNQYTAQQAQNPDLKFTDWLQNNQGNMQNQYANQNQLDRAGGFDSQAQKGLRWL